MKRRDFLTATTLGVTASLMGQTGKTAFGSDAGQKTQRFIELRIFETENEAKKTALMDKLDAELIPFRNDLGLDKVGIFAVNQELHKDDSGYDHRFDNVVFVVSESESVEKLAILTETLQQKDAPEASLNANPGDRDWINQTCGLLHAFPTCPQIEVPNMSPDRVLQLRCYYSPNYERNKAKMNMFGVRGELELFRHCNMNPVFFGNTLYGDMLPSVTYMLSFENDQARQEGWQKFVKSDEWKAMSQESAFNDTAIRIRNLFLKPSAKSQI
ncbi:MAG: NIPSNAP family protein [Thermoguttaceae bacterium]|nr:NIPSNAP family protein [Thermoguttaceae bacterium]